MNALLRNFSLQFLCLLLNAFDISELSYSDECGTDGWELVYRQTASHGGFQHGTWCTTSKCSYTPCCNNDILDFNNLEAYKADSGAWAFTLVWDNEYFIQWEQGDNPVYTSANSISNWAQTAYYYTLTVSDVMNQYGRMDFNGLGMSADPGITFDGGSSAGAYYAIGVSTDMQLMDYEDGIPGFISLSGFNYTANFVQLWVWKPECGDWWVQQEPSVSPTWVPTPIPTQNPSMAPTNQPTTHPSDVPTEAPTVNPTMIPTVQPTEIPTPFPTSVPSTTPTQMPTLSPTASPTVNPTESPTPVPTMHPTDIPTTVPTVIPTKSPTSAPTPTPTNMPSRGPTRDPTPSPSPSPSVSPTSYPTDIPTNIPSPSPTLSPSVTPTSNPTFSPTDNPTFIPTLKPTSIPTANPTTAYPTYNPTNYPTEQPTNDPTAPPTDHPTAKPSQRPTSELPPALVSVNTDREPFSLIIITSVALLLFIIFLMFTFWLCMTKRVPRFSLCENARGKSWKKRSAKYVNSISFDRSSHSHSDFEPQKKQTKRRDSQIELYVVTPQGECESSFTEGTSLVEINSETPPYYSKQQQNLNSPILIYSAIATNVITPDTYERSDSSSQFNPIIDPSLVIQDSTRPQQIVIPQESSASSVKNALSEYLTPRETIELQESEFCKARETRQVTNIELFAPRETRELRSLQNGGLNPIEDNVSEGENSTSDSCESSLLSDLQPNTVSSHLDVQRIFSGPQGEMNTKSNEYATSPGENIAQRKQTIGTRYLNNLRIADSFIVGPLGTGEVAEENDIFGIDSRVYEAKGAQVEFDKVN